jgi:streptogramin lyase
MRSPVAKLLAPLAVLVALLALAGSAAAAPAVSGIFPLATEVETNNKITAGPDGNMWFTLDSTTKDVAKITPAGVVEEFELPKVEEVAQGIAVGPDGRLWVPSNEKVTSFSASDPKGSEHTFAVPTIKKGGQIVAGPDGQMWVASEESLVHFSTANPEGAQKVPFTGKLQPRDIDVAGPLIVIADNGGGLDEKPRVDTFTTAGIEKGYDLPGMTQGVAGAPGGQIAYTSPGAMPEQAGLIAPPTASVPFELLNDPFGATFGSDKAFWIAQFAGTLTRVSPTGAHTTIGGLPKETARQIAAGPNNTLWVTLIKKEGSVPVSAIARVSGLEPPVVTPPPVPTPAPLPITTRPQTKLGKGPKGVVETTRGKATVKFAFSSSAAGASFECALTKGTKTKKGKLRFATASFHGCRSPKSYRVGVGSYRFKVRAGSAGGVDSTPAERRFRVARTHK